MCVYECGIVDSRFFLPPSLPRALIRIFFKQAASLFPLIHTYLSPPLLPPRVYNDTARIFLFTFRNLRGNGENIPQPPSSLASPRPLSSYPFLFLASFLPFFTLSLSLSLGCAYGHRIFIEIQAGFTYHPIRTFPVIHPRYLIPSLLICTECWDLLLLRVVVRAKRDCSGLNLCSELARQFAPYIGIYGANRLSVIFTVSEWIQWTFWR